MDNLIRAARGAVHAEDWVRAWHLCNAELNERPDRPEALYLMGVILRNQGHVGLAMQTLRRGLSFEQKQPNLWMNYAACLHDLSRWDEAIEAFNVVSGMCPDDAMPIANISASYVQKGKNHDALNAADRALSVDPENYIARVAKGMACLGLGRWKDAWEHVEALYGNQLAIRVYNKPGEEEPDWDGSKGKTVVVQCDQGIGDQIMFSQCLPEMAKDCKQVIVECQERMVGYFRRNFPQVIVYGTQKQQGITWPNEYKIDAHVHISYLGRWYRKTDKEFPRKAYATADKAKVEKWRGWLNQFAKPWIGVSWKGGIAATQKHLRSIDLADLSPVLSLPGSFIDLSYMDNGLEIARWNIDNKNQVICPPIDKGDYDDTIALAAALDEVVTVTTSLVHVCGALGRSAKVLVPAVPQWRYQYRVDDGKGLIWYPKDSVQLFRRVEGETDWQPTIKRLCESLKKSAREPQKKAA